MADILSSLRAKRGPSIADLQTSEQLSPEDYYRMNQAPDESQFTKGFRTGVAGISAGDLAREALDMESAGDPNWRARLDQAELTRRENAMYAPRVSSLRDVHGVGDAADFVSGGFGQGLASTLPSLGAALLTRGIAGKAGAFGGAMVPAYRMEKGEAALGQYEDPTMAAAPVDQRQLAATGKAGVNMALEAVVPGGLANSLLRKPAKGFLQSVGRDAVMEGATEASQQVTGELANQYIDPNRKMDGWDIADAAAIGALTGGGMGAGVRAPAHVLDKSMGAVEAGGSLVQPLLDKAKAGVEKAAPIDRVRAAFGRPEDAAEPVLLGDADPTLAGMDDAGTAANITKRGSDNIASTADMAASLLEDPSTPAILRDKIAGMNGDFTDPGNQKVVAGMYKGQAVARTAATKVQGLIEAARGMAPGVKQGVADFVEGVKNGVTSKKNLMSATPEEQSAIDALIFDALTPEAKAVPEVRQKLSQLGNALVALAARTGDITPKDMGAIARVQDAMELFTDPEALSEQLIKFTGGSPENGSFLQRMKQFRNAQEDSKNPNSFLYMSLAPEIRNAPWMTSPFLTRLARAVDEHSTGKSTRGIPKGLEEAFGGKDNANTVLDYYYKQNHSTFMRGAPADQSVLDQGSEQEDSDFTENVDPETGEVIDYDAGTQGISVNDNPDMKATYHFSDAKAKRPFRKFVAERLSSGKSRREAGTAANSLRGQMADAQITPVSMKDYAAESGLDAEQEVIRIADDIKARIEGHKNRKEDRSKQIHELQGELTLLRETYKNGGAEAALDLYEVLRTESSEANDLMATDDDLSKMAGALKARTGRPTKLVFVREDGSELALSAESMWKHWAKRAGSGGGEASNTRIKRMFNEAVAAVMARPEIAHIKGDGSMPRVLLDRKMDMWNKRPDKALSPFTEQERIELKAAEGSIKSLQTKLDSAVEQYGDTTDDDRKDEIRTLLVDKITKLDEMVGDAKRSNAYIDKVAESGGGMSKETAKKIESMKAMNPLVGNRPMYSAYKTRLEQYKNAVKAMDDIDYMAQFEYNDNNRGGDREGTGVGKNKLLRTPINEQLSDAHTGDRLYEEDTGVAVGSEKGSSAKVTPSHLMKDRYETRHPQVMQELADIRTEMDGLGTTLGAGPKARALNLRMNGLIKELNKLEASRPREIVAAPVANKSPVQIIVDRAPDFAKKKEAAKFKGADWVLAAEGVANSYASRLAAAAREAGMLITNPNQIKPGQVVYLSVPGANRGFEMKGSVYTLIPELLMRGAVIRMDNEANAMRSHNITGEGVVYKRLRQLRFVEDQKPLYTEWNASAEQLAGREPEAEPQAQAQAQPSVDHIVMEEDYSSLNTPEDVLEFANRAKSEMDSLEAREWKDKTDREKALHEFLKDMFKQNGWAAFDWHSLFDGMKPTAAQKKQLDQLVSGRGEPEGKKSLQQTPTGPENFTQETADAIRAEIARIRGTDVRVAFRKFNPGQGSGEYHITDDKVHRLIRIGINASNPMSVAYHESMHDFFAMLGGSPDERHLKKDLLDAVSSPHVMKKLRELLAGHPDALAQIEDDREERLAYAYQFWAEGALVMGHTGNGIFQRIAKFLRELLGILSLDEKAAKLLQALDDGKFAEPSLVMAALQDLKAETLGDKINRYGGPIAKTAQKLFSTSADRLRETEVPALGELADMFLPEMGKERGELQFLQKRSQEVGKRLNAMAEILEGTTAVQRREAMRNLQEMKAPSSELEKKLAKYFKDMRDYMVASGVQRFDAKQKAWVPMGNVEHYFPRVWDKKQMKERETEFIALMTKYIGRNQARAVYEAVINGDGTVELNESEHHLGFTPFAKAVQNRVFDFIDENNAAAFAQFQSTDLAEVMTTYTQQAVHRAEYAKTFGNNGEAIGKKLIEAKRQGATEEELKMANTAVMAMEGTLGHDFNPRLKSFMSGMMTYQNVILLPMAMFSSLIDPLGIAMRSNDMKEAWTAFKYGMQGIAKAIVDGKPDEKEEMAKLLGIIDSQNMLEAMGHVYNSMHMSPTMKKINASFFRFNGMELWNHRMRVAAMMAAQRFIVRNQTNDRYMKELGITPADVFEQADGTIALTKDQLQAAGAPADQIEDIEKRIHAAVFKFVDGGVLRPNAAQRPIWGSDPRYALIFHLKQFTYSFHNTILKRVGEEFRQGNNQPAWILASYVPFMLVSDILRANLTNTVKTNADLFGVLSNSIARSGVTGIWNFGVDAAGDVAHGKIPGTSFLGPSVDHMMTLAGAAFGEESATKATLRSVPFGSALKGYVN